MAAPKKYVVADKGYVFKDRVYKTGETIELSSTEFENVKHLVVEPKSEEGKNLLAQVEADQGKEIEDTKETK
jgi:hypothetical protein